MGDSIEELFSKQIHDARDALEHGQFVQCGQKLGSAQTLALLHASGLVQYKEEADRRKREWADRREWAHECADFARKMQSSVEECGTMRVTVGPEIAAGITNLSARMGIIPQRVLGMGLDLITFALDVIDDGREVRLNGPGIQVSVTGEGGQGEML